VIVGLVPQGKPTRKVLNLNMKLVCAPIDKLRRIVGGGGAHVHAAVPSSGLSLGQMDGQGNSQ
jgi:hypothetical protein